MLNYTYINNKSEKLIIIFQGYNRANEIERIYNIKEKEVYTSEFNSFCKKYNYYSFTENLNYDYLFVEDNVDNKMSFFLFSQDKYILPNLVRELDSFIFNNGYLRENVISFGSSKGGWAARLFAYNCSLIGNVLAVIPVFNLDWIRKPTKYSHMLFFQELLFGTEEKRSIIKNLNYEMFNFNDVTVREYIFSGKKDPFYVEDIICYKNPNTTHIIDLKTRGHAPVVTVNMNNFFQMIEEILTKAEISVPKNCTMNVGAQNNLEFFTNINRNFKKMKAKTEVPEDNFKFVDNNAKNILIVFQSHGRIPESFKDGKNDSAEVSKYHSKLNYLNFSENTDFDVLYVLDNYNNSYGFYLIHENIAIFSLIRKKIQSYIDRKEYESVKTFGTSKGGWAAISYGCSMDSITDIVSGVPVIDVLQFSKKHDLFLHARIKKNEEVLFFAKYFLINALENTKKKVTIVTGIREDNFKKLVNINKENIVLVVESENLGHNGIAKKHMDFMKSSLL